MRICSIITSFTSGGAETLVCSLSRAYARAGHAPTVVALCDAVGVGNSAETEARMIAELRVAGVQVRSLGLATRHNPLAGAQRLRRTLRETKPDIVHAHTARAAFMLMAAGARVPSILTHHNSRLSFPPLLFRLFDQFVAGYVAISEEVAATTRLHVARPVTLIVNSADAAFRAEAPRDRPSSPPVVLSVGTLCEQKNYPLLIEAAKRLSADPGRPRLRVAGDGALRPMLEELIRKAGVGAGVELLGPRGDVPALMRNADAFLNCSHYEGLSVAMIEALSSGLPIVATDVPGNRELVIEGVNGMLVPAGDADRLAEALTELLSRPEVYARLSRGAMTSARRFSMEGCVDAHLDLYARSVDHGRGQARAA